MNDYLNTNFKTLLRIIYHAVIQLFTPPPQLIRISLLSSLSNHLAHALHLLTGGVTVYEPQFHKGTFKTRYNYVRCCTTKYIFVLGKNMFDNLGLSLVTKHSPDPAKGSS